MSKKKIKVQPVKYYPPEEIESYPNNPRKIKPYALQKLAQSISDDPEYFEARPILASSRTGNLVALGGNQRLAAAKHLGLANVPVVVMDNLTEDHELRLLFKDNADNFGEFDYQIIELMDWHKLLQDDTIGVELPAYLAAIDDNDHSGVDAEKHDGQDPIIERSFKVYFQDQDEQDLFFEFLGKLRDKYPVEETVSQRLLAYCAELQKENKEMKDYERFMLLVKTDINNI